MLLGQQSQSWPLASMCLYASTYKHLHVHLPHTTKKYPFKAELGLGAQVSGGMCVSCVHSPKFPAKYQKQTNETKQSKSKLNTLGGSVWLSAEAKLQDSLGLGKWTRVNWVSSPSEEMELNIKQFVTPVRWNINNSRPCHLLSMFKHLKPDKKS